MIVPGEGNEGVKSSKGSVDPNASPVNRQSVVPAEAPPPYAQSSSNVAGPSSKALPLVPASTSSSPTPSSNFISVHRWNGSIKGNWVINPAIYIPESLLPAKSYSDERKNLDLQGWNGSIEADVTIPDVKLESGKISLLCKTVNGKVKVTIRRPEGIAPFALHSKTNNGEVIACIPRNFRGTLNASTWNGSITLSPAVLQYQTTFSDLSSKTRKSFIGDADSTARFLSEEGKGLDGDELVLFSTNGSIRVAYGDEVPTHGWQKWFAKLLG